MKQCFVMLCCAAGLALDGGCSSEVPRPLTDTPKDVIWLDVRTPEEFAEGHINTALNLPYDEIEAKASTLLPDKAATIHVYCRSGRRSAIAVQTLKTLGYTNLHDRGGINSLQQHLNTPSKE